MCALQRCGSYTWAERTDTLNTHPEHKSNTHWCRKSAAVETRSLSAGPSDLLQVIDLIGFSNQARVNRLLFCSLITWLEHTIHTFAWKCAQTRSLKKKFTMWNEKRKCSQRSRSEHSATVAVKTLLTNINPTGAKVLKVRPHLLQPLFSRSDVMVGWPRFYLINSIYSFTELSLLACPIHYTGTLTQYKLSNFNLRDVTLLIFRHICAYIW